MLTYAIFSKADTQTFLAGLGGATYLGIFIAGIFLSMAATAPLAVGLFFSLHPESLLLAIILGSLGSVLGDLFIITLMQVSFQDECKHLRKTKSMKKMQEKIKQTLPTYVHEYVPYILAGLIIVSPIPDEIGLGFLGGVTHFKILPFSVISFVLHGVFVSILVLSGAAF